MIATNPHDAASVTPLAVSVPVYAKMLGMGTTKAWETIHDGTMPHIRIGRAVRVPVVAIQRFIEASVAVR